MHNGKGDDARQWPGRRVAAWETPLMLCAACVAIGYALWWLLVDGTEAARTVASNFATPFLSTTAVLLARRAAQHPALDGDTARAWRLLAAAFLCMALGDVVWVVSEMVFGVQPAAGWFDVGYLLSYPLLLCALLAFPPRVVRPAERAKFWLDAFTVLVGCGMAVWYFVLLPMAARRGADPLAEAVAFAYLVGDLVLLLGLAAALLRHPPLHARRPLALLIAGLLLQLAGDLALARGALQEQYTTGGGTDVLWVLAYLLMAFSARVQLLDADRSECRDAPPLRRFWLLPYSAIALGYGLLPWVGLNDRSAVVGGLAVGAVLLTVIVFARQVVALKESQRQIAEDAMRRSEARFQSLVQNSSDVLTIVDAEGVITYQSPSAARILGPDLASVGGTLDSLACRDDVERLRAFLSAARADAATSVEWRLRLGTGSCIHLESTAANLLGDPTVQGIVINTRDITERKELEWRLGQAMKMEAVGRLAGGVAHDFNNLLTAIQGHTALLLEEHAPGSAVREDLEEIEHASRRAAELTRQLLAFSRRQVLQPKLIDINTVVADMERMLRRLIRENIELVVDLRARPATISVDPTQMEQVLMNLSVNAGDAMPEGGLLRIRTSTARDAHGTLQVVLEVADDGIGMNEATAAHIFEPFFTTKAPGKGTGLGLATVYGIVQQSGGSIDVRSAPGEGATFRISFPAARGSLSRREQAGSAMSVGGTETVLVVEDEPAVRALARRALERNGYRVLEAADGVEAMQLSGAAEHIDLLLTDVVMPRMGGPELARSMRLFRPDLPVLYVSGYTDDEAVLMGALGGGAAFCQKPFTPNVLTAKVRAVLDASVAAVA